MFPHLLARWRGGGRTFTAIAPDIEPMLAMHDAGLVIGDPALKIDPSRYITYDLAEEWIRLTGKPFVFAFWAVRHAALKDEWLRDGFQTGPERPRAQLYRWGGRKCTAGIDPRCSGQSLWHHEFRRVERGLLRPVLLRRLWRGLQADSLNLTNE